IIEAGFGAAAQPIASACVARTRTVTRTRIVPAACIVPVACIVSAAAGAARSLCGAAARGGIERELAIAARDEEPGAHERQRQPREKLEVTAARFARHRFWHTPEGSARGTVVPRFWRRSDSCFPRAA